jgi:two-component system sensor histidine kinase QseC
MRARLFAILIVTTGIVWLSAVAWILISTRAEVENVLDSRLMEAANMVSSLVDQQDVDMARAASLVTKDLPIRHGNYERQLSCQIWSFEGNLLTKSEGAPNLQLSSHRSGFSETEIDGETWRVYAVENTALGIRVLVGDSLHIRDGLVNDVIKGLLLPALLIVPLLAGLIWLSVEKGLAPLRRMATALSSRSAVDLTPLQLEEATSEIRPVVKAFNDLFTRVGAARDRERNFTAFAAHELRTPLAGLKTQAQIALASDEPVIRDRALQQIIQSANRTGRVIRQLLDMATVDATGASAPSEFVNLGKVLGFLRDELVGPSGPGQMWFAPSLREVEIRINRDLLVLALRNIVENAILHTAPHSAVTCHLVEYEDTIAIAVDDDGPGIPDDEVDKVTERFFRGRNKTANGTGLGLSIVEMALQQADSQLRLINRTEGGLSAQILINRNRVIRLAQGDQPSHQDSPLSA